MPGSAFISMRLKVSSKYGLTYSAQTNFEIISGCYTLAATVVSKNSISSLYSSGNWIV